ncbi:hypothetical protein H7F15_14020 [Pontibacter sp. Tf4]|uniref:hypothetical protein n=1 Tax=Pontibacter sp. Tf4 TaxID=2761620 RepID=UPI001626A8DA|nr:hypothetical protein [Pontibacter sp. Tf4]MBB6612162.1 hypothetical protein [Pontibacter sp. Tf4]
MKKALTTIVLVLLLALSSNAQAPTHELHTFVKRFEYFLKTNTAKLSLSATDSANTMPVPMPNALDATKTRVTDPSTGLWVYPNMGKVYDPETGYYIAYEGQYYYQYKADTASAKIYKGKTEIEIKRLKQDAARQ